MLFVLAAVFGGLAVGALLGGSWDRLEKLRVRGGRLLVAAVLVQLLASLAFRGTPYVLGLLASLALAVAFVARNGQLAGRGLLVCGLAVNVLVIVANGAMPVRLAAAERAGVAASSLTDDPRHEPETGDTRFALLDDRIPLPLPLGAQVLSVGDTLVAAGAGLLVAQAMRRRTTVLPPVAVRAASARAPRQ